MNAQDVIISRVSTVWESLPRAVAKFDDLEEKNTGSSPSKGFIKPMTGTYTAVEVSAPNQLRVVERRVAEPGPGQVRIRVEACGICHTDMSTVTGTYPGLTLPRVPGHEVIGRIEALGSGVSKWKIGQRVGVGLIAGEDGVCESCRRGDPVNCQNPVTSGVTSDGGYAEVMIAEARGIASIPDELSSAEAAPLVCAADCGRCTGRSSFIGCFVAPLWGRSVYGSLTGTPIDSEDTLAFSVLASIRPKIETVPLEQAAEAYDRMMQGKARFRIVLVTKAGFAQSQRNAG